MPSTETFESVFVCFVTWWSAGIVFHAFLHFFGVLASPRHAEEIIKL